MTNVHSGRASAARTSSYSCRYAVRKRAARSNLTGSKPNPQSGISDSLRSSISSSSSSANRRRNTLERSSALATSRLVNWAGVACPARSAPVRRAIVNRRPAGDREGYPTPRGRTSKHPTTDWRHCSRGTKSRAVSPLTETATESPPASCALASHRWITKAVAMEPG